MGSGFYDLFLEIIYSFRKIKTLSRLIRSTATPPPNVDPRSRHWLLASFINDSPFILSDRQSTPIGKRRLEPANLTPLATEKNKPFSRQYLAVGQHAVEPFSIGEHQSIVLYTLAYLSCFLPSQDTLLCVIYTEAVYWKHDAVLLGSAT